MGTWALLSACSSGSGGQPSGTVTVPPEPSMAPPAVKAKLRPVAGKVDLGGLTVNTWSYDGRIPGAEIRAKAGEVVQVKVQNDLPAETSVHWHGIRLHNSADGVPGLTQDPIANGDEYTYTFTVPDPGTYFFHPHSGVQLDRGLYAPLIVDDPSEPGGYDLEWVVVLDDWTDGVGKNPDQILAAYKAENGTVSKGMNHDMDHSASSPLGDVGDIDYPHYLINGRVPAQPLTLQGKPGQKARIRIINAASDTLFRVALGGHTVTVTHTDGFAVQPSTTKALYISQGERVDLLVTLGDGVFPLVASAEGKDGQGLILVRTGSGAAPKANVRPSELDSDPLLLTKLAPTEESRLDDREPDETQQVTLNGQMKPYAWGMNGTTFGNDTPLRTSEGKRVRFQMMNMTMMAHPMHIHGHTWSLPSSGGLRKDTVLVLPMESITVDLEADNPGRWAYHCHNIYHAEIGMMTSLQY